MNLAAFLHRTALLHPDATALGKGPARVASYREFARRVAVLAGRLTGRLGLEPGDRAAIVMANVPDYMVVKYACWHAGICCTMAWLSWWGPVTTVAMVSLWLGSCTWLALRCPCGVPCRFASPSPLNICAMASGLVCSAWLTSPNPAEPHFGLMRCSVSARVGRCLSSWRICFGVGSSCSLGR